MFKILASVTLIAFLSAASANAVVIDTFDISQALKANSGITQDSGVAGLDASILGGERDMLLDWFSGAANLELTANAGSPGNGLLSFSAGAQTSGQGEVVWDGDDGDPLSLNPLGLGGIDLTDGGTLDRIAVGVESDDWPVHLVFEVYTNSFDWSSATLELPGGISSAQTFELLFSAFTPQVASIGAGADFTNVGAIRLIIDDQRAETDLSIRFVESTPEPATLSLLALGGLALLRRRRR